MEPTEENKSEERESSAARISAVCKSVQAYAQCSILTLYDASDIRDVKRTGCAPKRDDIDALVATLLEPPVMAMQSIKRKCISLVEDDD